MSIPVFKHHTVLLLAASLTFVAAGAQDDSLKVRLSADTVGRYDRLEMTVEGVGDFERPHDPAVVRVDAVLTSPAGDAIQIPAFAAHTMEYKQMGNGMSFQPVGDLVWNIRFAPLEVGNYKGFVHVTAAEKTRESKPFEFTVTTSNNKGMIRVAKANPCAFEYDDGTPYVAIGNCLSWVGGGDRVEAYRKYLDKMSANGGNFIRVWLGAEWCFGILANKPYIYNEDAAALMDEVLQMCEQRGIAVKLCFEHVRRFEKVRNMGNTRPDYPFMKANGGPCETLEEFMTKEEAKDQWKVLQRYIVARWGASTSVFAWELWNEFNETDFYRAAEYPNSTKDIALAAWTEEMCAHLKSIDPSKHLTTNSLGSSGLLTRIWDKPSVDLVQYHDYGGVRHKGLTQYEVYAPAVNYLLMHKKPVLVAECGLVADDWGPYAATNASERVQGPKDAKGYSFHEALWGPFFAGAAGTGHHWWWDSMIDPWNLYVQYRPFAAFVKDIPLNAAPFPPVESVVEPENLRCYARAGNWGAIAWLTDRNSSWQALVLENKTPEKVSNAKLILPDLPLGKYNITCTNTWTGETVEETQVTLKDMRQPIPLPEFEIDMAMKLVKLD